MTAPKPTPSIPAYPNLLRPGSPVLFSPEYVERYHHTGGIAFNFGCDEAHVTWGENHRPALIPLSELRLDLSNGTGMCHAARWLAGCHGYDPGVTAPDWRLVEGVWTLTGIDGWKIWQHWFRELPATLSPAEALAAACVAVGGAG